MTNTQTPRTNAACEAMSVNHTSAWPKTVPVDFAADLEREVDELKRQLAEAQAALANKTLETARQVQDARIAVSTIHRAVEAYSDACNTSGGEVDNTWEDLMKAQHETYTWMLKDSDKVFVRTKLIEDSDKNLGKPA